MIKKFFATFVFLLFLGTQAFSYGVLAHPRKVYVLSTNHFDILFPEEDKVLAKYLADNADSFYDKANLALNTTADFRIPIVLSPDSDVLSVDYTSYPFYRMIIFDAVPDAEFADYKTTFDDLFYHEVFSAIAQSIMSPFNQIVKNLTGSNAYNPIPLINLPFSFVEGFVYANNSDMELNKFNDSYYLKVLSQSKLENKFPTWFQTFSARDIYPENELAIAAGSTFAAYLITTYGIEKYIDFWKECGSLHPYFTVGIFYKIYGQQISKVWNSFRDSIPFPEELTKLNELETEIDRLFLDSESNFEQLVLSKHGLIWYDSVRHEIDLYDFNKKNQRKKIFFADNIQRLEVSADGNYLAVSHIETESSENFKEQKVWIYDLENEKLLSDELELSDVTFVTFPDEKYGLAGLSKKQNRLFLEIFELDFEEDNHTVKVFEKEFEDASLLSSIIPNKKGTVVFNYFANKENYIAEYSFVDNSINFYKIESENGQIKTQNLKLQELNGQPVITFEYLLKNENLFSRVGYFSSDFKEVYLQVNDVSGGINYPVFANEKIYFSAKKVEHDELEILPIDKIEFKKAIISKCTVDFESNNYDSLFIADAESLEISNLQFEGYKLKKYFPLKYMMHISIIPFMAIDDITVDETPSMVPGLGLTLKTSADPLQNNQVVVSGAWKFIDLDYQWATNAPKEKEKDIEQEIIEKKKDKSIVCYFENTSTPIDIKGGAIFRCNLDGEYDFNAVFGGNWHVPLGMSFVKLNFQVDGFYSASTDYYDSNLIGKYESLKNWPSFFDAYDLFYASTTASFTNIHQYGISKFQNFGVSFGVRLYSLWDLYEIKLLEKAMEENKNKEELTLAQKQAMYNSDGLHITQLNLGLFATVALPGLIPVRMYKGWVISLPTTFTLEIFNKSGNAIAFNAETLLIGKEINQGIPLLYLFFNRIGLKFGYNLNLNYDTTVVTLPDIRNSNYLSQVFSNSFYQGSFYLLFNMNNTIPIGALSDKIINSQFKVNYFPDTQGFTISLLFDVKF